MVHKKNLTNSPKQSPSVLISSVLSPLVSSTKLFLNHVCQTTYIHSIFSIKDPKKNFFNFSKKSTLNLIGQTIHFLSKCIYLKYLIKSY